MSCCSKEKMEGNDYKSQSARSDRGIYRVCPSKLSKRELEDLYFTLMENNLDLKKTVNKQQDKIRVLSTQVQRMTNAQEKLVSKEMKECCVGTKIIINEQKDFITELKEANQRLSERIQHLNMRLSSAKQFLKTQPQMSSTKSLRYSSTPKKHDCLSKGIEPVLKLSTSSQWEDRTPRKSAQTETLEPFNTSSDRPCGENKCRSLMEELKMKLVTLQEELFNVHDEYSTRISRLESEVADVRKENVRERGQRTASEHELQNVTKRNNDILANYRCAEAKCAELNTQLSIEKRKVAELETQLKAANMSNKVNKTIEDHLTTIQQSNSPSLAGVETKSPTRHQDESKICKYCCDDSGYMDADRSQDMDELGLLKHNRELITKILELQYQVDSLKISETKTPVEQKENRKSIKDENYEPVNQSGKRLSKQFSAISEKDETSKTGSRRVSRQISQDTSAKIMDNVENNLQKTDQHSPRNSEDSKNNRRPSKTDKMIETGNPELESPKHNEKLKIPETEERMPSVLESATNDDQEPYNTTTNPKRIVPKQPKSSNNTANESVPSSPENKVTKQPSIVSSSKSGKASDDNLEVQPGKKLSTTEALVTDNGTTVIPIDDVEEVRNDQSERKPAYSSDKGSKTIQQIAINPSISKIGIKNEQLKESDSLQIPAPMPSDNHKKDKKKITHRHLSLDKKKDKSIKQKIQSKEGLQRTNSTIEDYINRPNVPLIQKTGDNSATNYYRLSKNSIQEPMKDVAMNNYYQSERVLLQVTQVERKSDVAQNIDQKLRESSNQAAIGIQAQQSKNKSPKHQRRLSSTSERGTYTVGSKQTSSPDNTELEMSYLSDLPMEKEKKNPRKSRPLSPGEDTLSSTSTCSDWDNSPATCYSLSEGEMPTAAVTKRRVFYNKDRNRQFSAEPAQNREVSPPTQMKATLQAIADELTRCNNLLHAHPTEIAACST